MDRKRLAEKANFGKFCCDPLKKHKSNISKGLKKISEEVAKKWKASKQRQFWPPKFHKKP